VRCSRIERRFSEYLDGMLPPGAEAEVEAHVGACGDCRAALNMLKSSLEALDGARVARPAGDLWTAFQARLAASEPPPAPVLCSQAEELLPAYVDAALAPEEQSGVRAHLQTCRRCAASAEALQGSLALLEALPPAAPPPDLWERIAARLEPPRRRWNLAAWPAAGFATALAAVLLVAALRPPLPGCPNSPSVAPGHNNDMVAVAPLTERPPVQIQRSQALREKGARVAVRQALRRPRRMRAPRRTLLARATPQRLPARRGHEAPVAAHDGEMGTLKPVATQPPVVIVSRHSAAQLKKLALSLAPVGESLEKAPRLNELLPDPPTESDAPQ